MPEVGVDAESEKGQVAGLVRKQLLMSLMSFSDRIRFERR